MGLDIKAIIVLFVYGISINLILANLAYTFTSITCPIEYYGSNEYDPSFNSTSSFNSTDLPDQITSNPLNLVNMVITVVNLVTDSCTGIPYILIMIFEIPIFIAFAYVVRGFIGAT